LLTVPLGGLFSPSCYLEGRQGDKKMKRLICASAALAFAIAPAGAEHRYDRKLEQAAMKIVAEKIGDIRGGFSYGQKPQLVVAQAGFAPNGGLEQRQDVGSSSSIVMPDERSAR